MRKVSGWLGAAITIRLSSNQGSTRRPGSWQGPLVRSMSVAKVTTSCTAEPVLPMLALTLTPGYFHSKETSRRGST